jgi:hypothetical protein
MVRRRVHHIEEAIQFGDPFTGYNHFLGKIVVLLDGGQIMFGRTFPNEISNQVFLLFVAGLTIDSGREPQANT